MQNMAEMIVDHVFKQISKDLDWKLNKMNRVKKTDKKTKAKVERGSDGRVTSVQGGLLAATELTKHPEGYKYNLLRTLTHKKLRQQMFGEIMRTAELVGDSQIQKNKQKMVNTMKEQIHRDRRLRKKHAHIAKKKALKSEKKNHMKQNAEELQMPTGTYKDFLDLVKSNGRKQ